MDATQWTGVISFGLAAATCLVAGCRPWPLLTIVNAGFAAECALGWRQATRIHAGEIDRSACASLIS